MIALDSFPHLAQLGIPDKDWTYQMAALGVLKRSP